MALDGGRMWGHGRRAVVVPADGHAALGRRDVAGEPSLGGRWNAGEAMMQDASPTQWERMVRLYKSCPQDSSTELCEATMTVRTVPPGRAAGDKGNGYFTIPDSAS